MMTRPAVIHYFDYKSPYAYLAQAATFALEQDYGITVDFRPYTLHIPSYLGSAEVDEQGNVLAEQRNAHQWRRVKYSYMDCRREANRMGLTIRGTRKIFDTTTAHMAFLYAKANGDWQGFHSAVFERFWKRELALEDPAVLTALMSEVGIDPAGFADYLAGPGPEELRRMQADAEEQGVFGVPSYLVDGELYWGAERLERVRERLDTA